MKQFISFVIKEARHILRDKRTMLILFGMPVVMMLIFGFAITTDVKNVRTVVVTSQMDLQTQRAVEQLSQSEYFTITQIATTPKDAELLIRKQKADMAIVFAPDFASKHTGMQFIVDGADPNMAQQWTNYATQVIKNMSGGVVNPKLLYNTPVRDKKPKENLVISIIFRIFVGVNQIVTNNIKRLPNDFKGQSYRNFLYY